MGLPATAISIEACLAFSMHRGADTQRVWAMPNEKGAGLLRPLFNTLSGVTYMPEPGP